MQQSDIKNLKLLGKRIRELRLQKSKSLNKFVFNHTGVTSATWSRAENGLVDIKFSTLIKIASMLELNISDLVKDLDIDYDISE